MRLIQLRANKKGFHTIKFNESGISLIIAKQKSEDNKNTYNSVGKSLSIALIHFCLGSNPIADFTEKLKDWIFYLDFEINGKAYTSERFTENQNIILLNGEETSLTDFRTFMGKEVFGIDEPFAYLSFRTLISRFIRPRRNSYNNYYKCINEEPPYSRLLNTSYLLGLDVDKIEKKNRLKEEHDTVKILESKIQKDTVLKSFFTSDESTDDIKIKIVDLERKIKVLQSDTDNFVIADDYNDIKKEADDISRKLGRLKNEATKYKIAISNIDRSLAIKPDITEQQLKGFYNEANIELSEMIVKRLEDIKIFNARILGNRAINLHRERKTFSSLLDDIEVRIKKLGKQEDEKLQYLKSHGALDDYIGLNNQLTAYKVDLDKLNQYQNLIKEYKKKKGQINKNMVEENAATEQYFEDIDSHIKDIILIFQTLSEQFYKDKSAGITIENNAGINKIRYNIDAKIADDTGDGVNDVKTFCFDWTLLKGQYNHNVQFIFHDSRLISEIDTRQIATMLRIAYKECSAHKFQYILSINQSILDNLKKELSNDEYELFIEANEVLELDDLSDAGKLLGIQIDLNYDNN